MYTIWVGCIASIQLLTSRTNKIAIYWLGYSWKCLWYAMLGFLFLPCMYIINPLHACGFDNYFCCTRGRFSIFNSRVDDHEKVWCISLCEHPRGLKPLLMIVKCLRKRQSWFQRYKCCETRKNFVSDHAFYLIRFSSNATIRISDAGKNHCLFSMLDFMVKTVHKQSQVLSEVKDDWEWLKKLKKNWRTWSIK